MDIDEEGICDTYEKHVWEPAMSKRNSLAAATEAASLILSVDETVRNPQSEQAQMQQQGMGRGGGGGGAPISAAMGGGGMKGMAQMMQGGGAGRGAGGRGMKVMQGRGGK